MNILGWDLTVFMSGSKFYECFLCWDSLRFSWWSQILLIWDSTSKISELKFTVNTLKHNQRGAPLGKPSRGASHWMLILARLGHLVQWNWKLRISYSTQLYRLMTMAPGSPYGSSTIKAVPAQKLGKLGDAWWKVVNLVNQLWICLMIL